MPTIGVYEIRCQITDKVYIGSSTSSIESRWNRHRSDLNHNKHPNAKLQNAWNKYGKHSFTFRVLLPCEPNNCLKMEQLYIDHYKPKLNICLKAHNTFGRKTSDETKAKMSLSHKGNKRNLGNTNKKGKYSEFYEQTALIAINQTQTITFNSFLTAQDMGFNRHEIKRHLAGRRKSYKGYVWSLQGALSRPS